MDGSHSAFRDGFSGQTAIVTGGADALGLALARRLAARGAAVALFDIDAGKLAAAKAELVDRCVTFAIDVTDPLAVRTAVAAIAAAFSSVDILVNCAGITGRTNVKSHEVDLADFDRVMNLNLRGSLITFQAVAPL